MSTRGFSNNDHHHKMQPCDTVKVDMEIKCGRASEIRNEIFSRAHFHFQLSKTADFS